MPTVVVGTLAIGFLRQQLLIKLSNNFVYLDPHLKKSNRFAHTELK